ncbi:TAT-binding protein-like protein 7, AAA ATPase [Basidiobolus ranarum]|uniref:TAT-binding protein-like protein 7, AAA ATPase n=1 Tax=Basidiobolus ranarum TaxID=34480 RepID=A0ABR2VT64_9FUNG
MLTLRLYYFYQQGRDPTNSVGNSRPYNLRNNRHSSYGPDSARDIIKLAQLEEQYNRLRHLENFTHSQKKRNFGHMLSNKGGASEEEESERIMPLNARQLNGRGRGLLRKGKGVSSGTANLADIDPVAVNEEVGFSSIGGLDSHIQSLKEMVLLHLLYPEIYTQFSITPPRGVLFYGPPGTGKTLVARALANSCSTESQKVAFFMRKGADCLSKWVGEAERQLRLLFEEAKAWQPSIIFFDEIDGLAPVRSSKQEQVHSSIVSTLLALMDGLDNRGQVVVIGATNRIDAIDPALRRPGRFDREFYFSLPNQVARRTIIDINTKKWNPPISEELKDRLAVMTKGYGGADLKALSTEAALKAIRRRYPQIYDSDEKLLIEPKNIEITAADFLEAIKTTIPCSQRSSPLQVNPLPTAIKPLLTNAWENILQILEPLIKNLKGKKNPRTSTDTGVLMLGELNDEEHYRPRLLISGESGMGQAYLGPAILNYLEDFHVYSFDTASLFGDESGTPETKCVHLFHEVKRHKPCVVYVPSIDHWWRSITDSMRNTFFSLLKDINPYDPIIFIATCDSPLSSLPSELLRMSDFAHRKNVNLRMPSKQSRELFFKTLIQDITKSPRFTEPIVSEPIPPLPLAPKPAPREPTEEERSLLKEHDEHVFRELRISLRSVTEELFKERKYKIFFKSVDPEEYPDYYFKVSEPMDLSTIMEKINLGQYRTVKEYLRDIDLIVGTLNFILVLTIRERTFTG